MCIAWLLGEILCRYQPCLFGLMCGVLWSFFVDLLSGWPIYWWQWGIQISHYLCVSVYLCSWGH
jgi:hypothetical protein